VLNHDFGDFEMRLKCVEIGENDLKSFYFGGNHF
jgi:hypothetical protein